MSTRSDSASNLLAVSRQFRHQVGWRLAAVMACFACTILVGNATAQNPANTAQRTQSTPPSTGPAGGEQMLPVVAMVNGQQVTRQLLANECIKRYGEQVIESIINKQLVVNELRRNNISITERDVNEEIKRQAAKVKLNTQAYLDLIREERNISVDRVKNDIFWMQLALQRLAATADSGHRRRDQSGHGCRVR